jgi:amidase
LARTAEDVRILFEVLAGYDPADPFSAPVPLRKPDLTGLRVGCMERFYKVPVQAAVARAIETAATCLRDIGIPVEPFEPRGLERSPNLWSFFFSELPARFTQEFIAGREDQVHWTATEFLKRALDAPDAGARKVVENLAARDKMRAALVREMEKFRVILAPVCSTSAFRHRQRRYATPEKEIGQFEAMMTATLFNLLGMPAMTIPFGRDEDGMPVGIQVAGRPWDEELLLELAVRMEQARGPFGGPPRY